jgi:DNA-directed RNA polymerase alpha subunit
MPELMTVSSPGHAEELRTGSPLAALGLTSRPLNSLLRHGVNTIAQLVTHSREQLKHEIRGLGAGGVAEVEAALARHGLNLATDSPGFRYPRPMSRNSRNHHAWQQPVSHPTSH